MPVQLAVAKLDMHTQQALSFIKRQQMAQTASVLLQHAADLWREGSSQQGGADAD